MSRLRANQITNENANGAPNFPHGLTVTGVVTMEVVAVTIPVTVKPCGKLGAPLAFSFVI